MSLQIDDPAMLKMDIMTKRYNKNLAFFKVKVPEIHRMVEKDESKPCFQIDPETNQAFRIENNQSVYKCDPITHAINEVNEFEFQLENGIYAPSATGITLTHLIKENPFAKTVECYDSIMNKYGRNNLKPAVKDIVIFGIGMGYHLEILCNKQEYRNITIIEHDIKNFKTSMHCINWEKILTNSKLETSITIHIRSSSAGKEEFEIELQRHCIRLYPTIGISTIIYNHFPDSHKYTEDKKVIEEFASFIKVNNEVLGPEAQRLFNANENIKNDYRAINLNTSKISEDKIVAVIGAGPSLDDYIDIIKNNRDKFFLLSAGSGLSSLIKMDVYPDLHFELEFQNLATTLLEFVNKDFSLKNIDLVCTFEACPGYPSLFRNAYMIIPESSELVDEFESVNKLKNGGITCTNGAAAFLSEITNGDIYFFGIDFAHTNGKHHSKTNIAWNTNLPNNLELVHTSMETINNSLPVTDTQGETITTSPGLNAARLAMENLVLTTDNKVFNCSYGADIKGSIFLSKKCLKDKLNEINSGDEVLFHPKTNKVDFVKIQERTVKILNKSILTANNIVKIIEELDGNSFEKANCIIKIFREMPGITNADRGQLRNIFSVSKSPLLQLFIIYNYVPESEQENIVSIWLNDYKSYIKYISDLFRDMFKDNNFYIKTDWVG